MEILNIIYIITLISLIIIISKFGFVLYIIDKLLRWSICLKTIAMLDNI